jgi:hypothetical protein
MVPFGIVASMSYAPFDELIQDGPAVDRQGAILAQGRETGKQLG